MSRRLVALHVHSWYSLLEGVDAPQRLLERAAQCGYSALAFTDTNNLYGAVAIQDLAWQYGVRPIFGACLRQIPSALESAGAASSDERERNTYSERKSTYPAAPFRCTVLIAEPKGYANLCIILSRLHLQAAPLEQLLQEHHEGLHVLVDEPYWLRVLQPTFRARLWAELIRPGRSSRREKALLESAARQGVRVVASSAVHFAEPQGYALFRWLTAIRQRTLLARVPTRLTITPAHHLARAEEIWSRFADVPEALVHAEQLAEQCRSDVLPRQLILPAPPEYWRQAPDADNAVELLRQLQSRCERALASRCGDTPAARARLEQELAIIAQRGLAGYFLVVQEIAQEARRRGYPLALRGSAGNCLVCYLLGITDVDPLRYQLPLERFLHAGRADLPDIDLDFDWRIRDEMIQWVCQRFGKSHTAQISSHLFFQPRSAFREAAKVCGLSGPQITQLLLRLEARLEEYLMDANSEAALQKWPEQLVRAGAGILAPEQWPRLLSAARQLLGRPHHLSLHPGGIVLTPDPLCRHVPLQRAPKGVLMTQFDKDGVERIGLVKIDLLGNRALATVAEVRQLVGTRPTIPETDEATVRLLQRGDTLGVNQLESPAMRHLLVQYQPRERDEVIHVLALIRPAAASVGNKELFLRRRRGMEPLPALPPQLDAILRDTCGLMIFEDQALLAIQAATGWPAAEADHLRKAISEGLPAESAAAWWQRFALACQQRGLARETAEFLWKQLARFNAYSFCKSHAVSYGWLAWEAAWYKAHYPVHFWTAALNNNLGMYPQWVYIEGVKWSGIRILPPCVNGSALEFRVEGNALRVGLGSIRGVPRPVLLRLLEERQRHGPFADVRDLCRRVPMGPEVLARLIQAGACDFMALPREEIFLEAALERRQCDDPAMFRSHLEPTLPALLPRAHAAYPQPNRRQLVLAACQWETLGFVLDVPLMQLFRPWVPADLDDSRALQRPPGSAVTLAGLVAASRLTPTAQGKTMQFLTLADEWGLVEVTIFPDACPLVPNPALGPYVVTGRIEDHFGARTLSATQPLIPAIPANHSPTEPE
ncbi:MAG: DNA polymerase III subunit alpha [Gemmatales bacterium]|nr:DNA polymerase III subunit alpha [Gemmatales bacterium]MDW7993274.1 DNA polymerase III subunit alpha [Gemmatales bacterium]